MTPHTSYTRGGKTTSKRSGSFSTGDHKQQAAASAAAAAAAYPSALARHRASYDTTPDANGCETPSDPATTYPRAVGMTHSFSPLESSSSSMGLKRTMIFPRVPNGCSRSTWPSAPLDRPVRIFRRLTITTEGRRPQPHALRATGGRARSQLARLAEGLQNQSCLVFCLFWCWMAFFAFFAFCLLGFAFCPTFPPQTAGLLARLFLPTCRQ